MTDRWRQIRGFERTIMHTRNDMLTTPSIKILASHVKLKVEGKKLNSSVFYSNTEFDNTLDYSVLEMKVRMTFLKVTSSYYLFENGDIGGSQLKIRSKAILVVFSQ